MFGSGLPGRSPPFKSNGGFDRRVPNRPSVKKQLVDKLQEALGSAYRIDEELEGGGMSRIYLATQQYYVQLPSGVYVAVWDGALKNYGPNLGYDYGGRLMAAWLDR